MTSLDLVAAQVTAAAAWLDSYTTGGALYQDAPGVVDIMHRRAAGLRAGLYRLEMANRSGHRTPDPAAVDQATTALSAEVTATAAWLDSYTNESALYQDAPGVVQNMRRYAIDLRRAVADLAAARLELARTLIGELGVPTADQVEDWMAAHGRLPAASNAPNDRDRVVIRSTLAAVQALAATAEIPPTAGQIAAHLDKGGTVERWHPWPAGGDWGLPMAYENRDLWASMPASEPQPGFRLSCRAGAHPTR